MADRIDLAAVSRRRLLGNLALFGGGAVLAGAGVARAAVSIKLSPGEAGYRPAPNGAAKCVTCKNWQGPNACRLVSGAISPEGWCTLYAKRA